jgi:antitoxin PrlF
MATALTSKGQVTAPKQIRDSLNLLSGCVVDVSVSAICDVPIHTASASKFAENASYTSDRFDNARGKAPFQGQI